jgi:hypothetical protein
MQIQIKKILLLSRWETLFSLLLWLTLGLFLQECNL